MAEVENTHVHVPKLYDHRGTKIKHFGFFKKTQALGQPTSKNF